MWWNSSRGQHRSPGPREVRQQLDAATHLLRNSRTHVKELYQQIARLRAQLMYRDHQIAELRALVAKLENHFAASVPSALDVTQEIKVVPLQEKGQP
jgi:cell division septum initiation protein DivIVA